MRKLFLKLLEIIKLFVVLIKIVTPVKCSNKLTAYVHGDYVLNQIYVSYNPDTYTVLSFSFQGANIHKMQYVLFTEGLHFKVFPGL